MFPMPQLVIAGIKALGTQWQCSILGQRSTPNRRFAGNFALQMVTHPQILPYFSKHI